MKRIIAMLLAAAAVVCCAGCGAGGGGAATTMTEEDFYVYENGEVVYTVSPGTSHDFTKEQETKRGIHIGSTLEEVVEAYKGECAQWFGYYMDENGTQKGFDYGDDRGIITLGENVLRERPGGSVLVIAGVKQKDGNIRIEKGLYTLKSGEMLCRFAIDIKENVVDSIDAWHSQYEQ